jgi:hypothetical protein
MQIQLNGEPLSGQTIECNTHEIPEYLGFCPRGRVDMAQWSNSRTDLFSVWRLHTTPILPTIAPPPDTKPSLYRRTDRMSPTGAAVFESVRMPPGW